MPRKKKVETEEKEEVVEEEEETEEEVETEKVKTSKAKTKGKSVSIFNKDSKVVRIYSTTDHGKNYKELAKQFVEKSNKKFAGRVDEKYRIK